MITDRDYLRAERDYLRPPSERAPQCPHCAESYDPDAGEELHADEAACLRLSAGEVVCPTCAAAALEDLAMLHAMRELGRLGWEWQKRAIRAAGGVA